MLLNIQAKWLAAGTLSERAESLATKLNAGTLPSDGTYDLIFGNAGSDWMVDPSHQDFFLDNFFFEDRKN